MPFLFSEMRRTPRPRTISKSVKRTFRELSRDSSLTKRELELLLKQHKPSTRYPRLQRQQLKKFRQKSNGAVYSGPAGFLDRILKVRLKDDSTKHVVPPEWKPHDFISRSSRPRDMSARPWNKGDKKPQPKRAKK